MQIRHLILLGLFLFLISELTFTQQVPIYSQYVANEFLINPSIAGVDGMTALNLSARKQWLGFKYAPETYSASITSRILKSPFSVNQSKVRKATKGRVGLGASFVSDKNGAVGRTTLQLTYAYHIFLNANQLSFGLSGTATQFKIDEELAELRRPDPIADVLGKSAYIPDANAGVALTNPSWHVGLSLSQILQSPVKFGNIDVAPKELKHMRTYTLYGFYTLDFRNNPYWQAEPSAILRMDETLRFIADISGRLIYKDKYWTGLAFRTSGEFIILFGMKKNNFYFGYSFDYGFNEISALSYGSHEISLAVKFGDDVRRYRWYERY